MQYTLERSQVIPRPVSEVFAFFAEPRNLEVLTTDYLRIRIVPPARAEMQGGALIDYRLRLFGLPFRWRSLIEDLEPGRRFVDVQVRGPYASWRHLHEFGEVSGGTLVRDSVLYALPMGPLGRLAHALFVRRTLERIFDYRMAKLVELFGSVPPGEATG
jgi:ligand-binding SRPBCC domain-containing protein